MTRIHDLCSFLGAMILACTLASPCFAENWPGFRGPTGQGISQEKNLPLTWSLHENLAWRAQIPGIGWSSPIVWEDRVFVTSATAGRDILPRALPRCRKRQDRLGQGGVPSGRRAARWPRTPMPPQRR